MSVQQQIAKDREWQIQRLMDRVAELEDELEGLKASGPPRTASAGYDESGPASALPTRRAGGGPE